LKISNVISGLTKIMAQHGDLEVEVLKNIIDNEYIQYDEMTEINVVEVDDDEDGPAKFVIMR
jgi:hypothetical protein